MPETTVTIKAVAGVKTGENAKGKPWKKYSFKGSDDHWYSTFTEGIGTRFVKGETLSLEYSEDDYGRTIKSITSSIEPLSASGLVSERFKAQTNDKDRLIVREVAWKAAATLLSGAANTNTTPAVSNLLDSARKLAHAIEHDIYRTTPQPPEPEKKEPGYLDDVPF